MKVHQVDSSEWAHVLWPVKHGDKADANLCSLTYKLLQGSKVKSDHKDNIVVQSSKADIALDDCIKTHDG